jgi:hypothetical protein
VTSTTSNGDLGGQTGADAECASLAAAANLPSATYKAWLSTSTLNAAAKLGTARGFVRPDGQPFADQVSDIAAGKILNPLILDESGNNLAHQIVWTGTTDAGIASPFACGDWLIGTGESFGELGETTGGAGAWSDDASETSCNVFAHLYCFGTSRVSALTVAPIAGRIAFVSKESFATSQGIAGADTLCQNEASAAGLANPTTFVALLSTSTVAAASRFDLSALSAPYVRPDGIEIADAPTIAAGSTLDSGMWQHADGSYVTEFAAATWTGSAAPKQHWTAVCHLPGLDDDQRRDHRLRGCQQRHGPLVEFEHEHFLSRAAIGLLPRAIGRRRLVNIFSLEPDLVVCENDRRIADVVKRDPGSQAVRQRRESLARRFQSWKSFQMKYPSEPAARRCPRISRAPRPEVLIPG